jgi:O-antigen ligase
LITITAGFALLSTVLADYRRWLLRFSGGGDPFEAQRSNKSRLGLLEQGWADFQRYPLFGAGVRHISEAHNIYLQLLAAGGVVLAVGFGAYFFFMFRDCWLLTRVGFNLPRFLMISIATWLMLGLIENEIVDRELYFTVGCVAALVVVSSKQPAPERKSPQRALSGHRLAN